jgi:phosphopantothenoylcysteine decarboxylase/phosphopantothenate--cysteine ligase
VLSGKNIVLGVSGGIAAYKSPALASMLTKQGADVHVVMTKNATEFVRPLTFESLTGNKCLVEMFGQGYSEQINHVALAKAADLIIVAPATANIIAKIAHGIADDMLTTTMVASVASGCPRIIAPAMNTHMYENPITQDNLATLKKYGFDVLDPTEGLLACGDFGAGKMPEPADLLDYIIYKIGAAKDMTGLKVLVTAGPTREEIDPVRYITNHSTGKMGYALARACAMRGAEVTLVSGPTALSTPPGVNVIDISSSAEMHDAVIAGIKGADMLFKAAAVADYTPVTRHDEKVKKSDGNWGLELKRTADILGDVSKLRRSNQVICGFSMETENLIENSRAKLEKKGLDMIAANNLEVEGAGFAVDTNVITLITKDEQIELGKKSKHETAMDIIDKALEIYKLRNIPV